jgi:hypothetical protein
MGETFVSTRARVAGIAGALVIAMTSVGASLASSHREAPLIAGDPSADNTDLYAFVSPDDPSTVTIIANYIPLEEPAGGPNFNPFDDAVRYEIHVDNNGDAVDDVTFRFRFKTIQKSGKDGVSSFLYNNGQVTSLTDANLLARQTYSVTMVKRGESTSLGSGLPTVPTNVGPRSVPEYAALAATGVRSLPGGISTYAGPRDDAFFVDLGSIFDLGGLRPFNGLHIIPLDPEEGTDGVAGFNTNTIAIKVPISKLRRNADHPTIGIWASASRKATKTISTGGKVSWTGPWTQVSRLGNPLVNEVIIPRHLKDYWNGQLPKNDKQFEKYYLKPELAGLVNFLYPATADIDTTNRTDLSLILLTGVPGVNSTGSVKADMLRLNTAIPPCTADSAADDTGKCRRLGVFYDDAAAAANPDLAAFPNGRRLEDDVTDQEIRAVAQGYGAILNTLFGLPNKSPNNLVGDGVDRNADMPFVSSFPYVGLPHQGYTHVHHGASLPS